MPPLPHPTCLPLQLAMKQRESKALEMQRALVEQLDLEQRQVRGCVCVAHVGV